MRLPMHSIRYVRQAMLDAAGWAHMLPLCNGMGFRGGIVQGMCCYCVNAVYLVRLRLANNTILYLPHNSYPQAMATYPQCYPQVTEY
jgi:hypothetical protein